MKKFGSNLKSFYCVYFFIWLIVMVGSIIGRGISISEFFIITLGFAAIGLIGLYQTGNGLKMQENDMIVCNPLALEKYRVLYKEIELIELVDAFRTSFIKIYTRTGKKKYFLQGFTKQDLLKCETELESNGVNVKCLLR